MDAKRQAMIKPCPYCGGNEQGYYGDNKPFMANGCYWIYCKFCEATGPRSNSLPDAIKRWNERAGR